MSLKETVILKFGGASVSSTEQFSRIAEIILNKSNELRVVVVVSAMGDTTDQLLSLAKRVHPDPPPREQDMLVSVGERISIALLAMALHLKNKEAISLTGSQSGIITSMKHAEAQIIDVKPHRILKALEEGKVVIVHSRRAKNATRSDCERWRQRCRNATFPLHQSPAGAR